MKTRIQIAILEDDLYFNRILTNHVGTICSKDLYPQFDFEIRSYQSAHEFLGHINESVDILLLDYYLYNSSVNEQLDGYQVLSIVKSLQPSCKVILLSSLSDSGILEGIKQKGIHAHVDKNMHSKGRVGAILQETMSQYLAIAS